MWAKRYGRCVSRGKRSLRRALAERAQVVACGAHDALSARLAEQAGFDAIWASGFGISAVRAVPDASILTMNETLEAARAMVDATTIPVIADCDTGCGNAINVLRTVQDFEAAGIAAICIEDNVFPKRCSFYSGVARELAPVEEHAGKVAAAKSAQRDPEFVVIARTEALISGWGHDEAMRRARAYADAGADAVLVHSKAPDLDELRCVARAWDRPTPLVAVPTTYIGTPLDELQSAGFRLVIYANQSLRAAVVAMRESLGRLRAGRALDVEREIAPLEEIYRLVGLDELRDNESRYLPMSGSPVTAVVLAAGDDGALGEITADRPRCMLDVRGRTVLERQVTALNANGIREIAVVRGYRREAVNVPNLRYFDNEQYAQSGEMVSFLLAARELEGSLLCLYGDVVFDDAIVARLLRATGDITVVVDRAFAESRRLGTLPPSALDLVVTEGGARPEAGRFVPGEGVRLRRIGQSLARDEADGEFIGLVLLSAAGAALVRQVCAELAGRPGGFHEALDLGRASLTDLLQELLDRGHDVDCVEVHKGWMEIDSFADYRRAWAELRG